MKISNERRENMVKEMVEQMLREAEEAAQNYYSAKNAPFEVNENKIENNIAIYHLKLGIAIGAKTALWTAGVNNWEETNKLIEEIDKIINIAYKGE